MLIRADFSLCLSPLFWQQTLPVSGALFLYPIPHLAFPEVSLPPDISSLSYPHQTLLSWYLLPRALLYDQRKSDDISLIVDPLILTGTFNTCIQMNEKCGNFSPCYKGWFLYTSSLASVT